MYLHAYRECALIDKSIFAALSQDLACEQLSSADALVLIPTERAEIW